AAALAASRSCVCSRCRAAASAAARLRSAASASAFQRCCGSELTVILISSVGLPHHWALITQRPRRRAAWRGGVLRHHTNVCRTWLVALASIWSPGSTTGRLAAHAAWLARGNAANPDGLQGCLTQMLPTPHARRPVARRY